MIRRKRNIVRAPEGKNAAAGGVWDSVGLTINRMVLAVTRQEPKPANMYSCFFIPAVSADSLFGQNQWRVRYRLLHLNHLRQRSIGSYFWSRETGFGETTGSLEQKVMDMLVVSRAFSVFGWQGKISNAWKFHEWRFYICNEAALGK